MAGLTQQRMNLSGTSRSAAVNSPDRQTGEAAAELWRPLQGLSAPVLLCAYADVLYGDEEQPTFSL